MLGKLLIIIGMSLWATLATSAEPVRSQADARPTVRWRGFNLLGMFIRGSSPGSFEEEDFQLIRELGFNFVRLPLDYRFWLKAGDWAQIDETQLKPIDQAIAWGEQYGIHVQLAFHRAPGYTVAQPPEEKNLFKDEEALRICAKHWAFLAKRYQDRPTSALSFNLFNEPAEISEADYERVATVLVQAIRQEDPDRLIVADGIAWGGRPALALFKLGIGQAMRGYQPMSVTHYLASWAGTPREPPRWPPGATAVSPLYGIGKQPWNLPLVLTEVPAGTLTIFPDEVSGQVVVRLEADGQPLSDYSLSPREGPGWTEVVFKPEWNLSQGRCTDSYAVKLPAPVKRLSLSIFAGDWAGFRKLTLTAADGQTAELPFATEWGKTNSAFRFAGFGSAQGFQPEAGVISGIAQLRRRVMAPWQPAFAAGITVMVGEFGVYQYTPHDLTLALLEDYLQLWQEYHLSWALWNFKGSFGILDSGRTDVQYEAFHGHQLDRQMLELLQKY